MNTIRPRSSQLTPPHAKASGTAATRATNGTAMKSRRATCSIVPLLSAPRVAEGSGAPPSDGAGTVGGGVDSSITSGVVVIGEPLG